MTEDSDMAEKKPIYMWPAHWDRPVAHGPNGAVSSNSVYATRAGLEILKKGGKSAVFAAQDGKAREIEVETGIASDGFIEILNPEAIEGKDIIVSGQYFVNDGSAVTVTNAK